MNAIKKYLRNHWGLRTKRLKNPDGTITEYLSIDFFEIKYALWKKYSAVEYACKKVFKPFNKLKLTQITNEYHEPDYLMFHAMFQCLVNHVELQHDYIPRELADKIGDKRFTDVKVMREYVLSELTPEGMECYFSDWDTPETRAHTIREIEKKAHISLEILYLYEWYKQKRYEFNDDLILHVDLSDVQKMFGNEVDVTSDQRQVYLTTQEHWELEEEHQDKCDHILRRVLAVRRHLWT
jgi:hypothetical protein